MKLLPAHSTASLINAVHHTDIFDLCERVYRAGVLVDMILCDLPYGTTQCAWDTVIPFEPMWTWFKRIVKANGAIVLTASQPFTSALVMSNPKMFKYELIWRKTRPSGFLHAKNKILKNHENIVVFSAGAAVHEGQTNNRMVYNPQMKKGNPYIKRSDPKVNLAWSNMVRPSTVDIYESVNSGTRYPTSVIDYPNDNHSSLHPTQKPVALFDYLIRTYTQVGDLVFDPTAGSGTTAVAARGCNRRYIVGDREQKYVDVMRERLAKPYQLDMFYHAQQQDAM